REHRHEADRHELHAALGTLARLVLGDVLVAHHPADVRQRRQIRLFLRRGDDGERDQEREREIAHLFYVIHPVMLRGTIAALVAILLLNPVASVDEAFDAFWQARDVAEASDRAAEVLRSGASFDEAYQRLKRGRRYTAQQSGTFRLTNRTADRIEHQYAITIPDGYDPSKKYQVRVQLHGGVMMRHSNAPPPNAGGIGALAGAEQIYIVPFAWDAEAWWTDDQVLNLCAILDRTKRDFNVDENRVVLSGVSDGGTGTYYTAMRETT